jgi:hypothetical protein
MAKRRSLLIDERDLTAMLELVDRINDCHPMMSASKRNMDEHDRAWLVEFHMTDKCWNRLLATGQYQFVLMTNNYVWVKKENT